MFAVTPFGVPSDTNTALIDGFVTAVNPVPEEQQVQYNFEEKTYTPVQRIEAFVMANFKEHLIERTLFISLLEVLNEAKQQEFEMSNKG